MADRIGNSLEDAEKEERKVPDRVLIGRVAKYALKYRRRFTIAVIAVLAVSLTMLLPPYIIKIAIDDYITNRNLTGLTFAAILLVSVYSVNWFFDYQRTYQVAWLGQNMVNEMRQQLFSHLQSLSFSFYDKSETGKIMSRITNDTETLSEMFVQGVVTLFSNVLTLVGIVVFMFLLSVPLTLVTLLVIPPLTLSTRIFQSRLRKAYRATRRKIAVVTSRLEESVSGIREIKSFTREQESMKTFRQANIENLQANVQAGRMFALAMPVVQTIGAIGTFIILWFSGMLATSGGVTLGVVVAFLLYVNMFFRPIIDLTMFFNTIQSSMAAAERIFETLDTKPEITNAKDSIELPRVQGEIVFDNITFGYNPVNPVIRDVDIHVEPGEILAIVGPTGAGKSTLVKLLSRFYEPQFGTIEVDGYDIRNASLDSLHEQMGVVLQEPFLFSGTVMENLRYGKLDATDEEVKNAAEMVGAHDFIKALPRGYGSDVGEKGTRLSVGQRQLISFARALLRDPPILILDEATSSIDPYTELKIKRGLSILLKNRTTIAIAHRLSTVRNADNIIVVDQGRIIEEGNHRELMKKKGMYYRLYNKQFKDT